MGRDVEASLNAALGAGVAFSQGDDALSLFREAVATAIREIESHKRGRLLQRFLRYGPRDGSGEESVTDEDAIAAINFICFYVVNSFQGSIAELLSAGPCAELLHELKRRGQVPSEAVLYSGDAVTASQFARARSAKAADFCVLVTSDRGRRVTVAGVAEVKSYSCTPLKLRPQFARHIARARLGLRVLDRDYAAPCVQIGCGSGRPALRIMVVPSTWKLPRTISWNDGRTLRMDEPVSPMEGNVVTRIDKNTWRITLRWSHEALAADAYEMTFWYMSKVGEVIFRSGSPWPEMTPAQAGLNAVKWALNRVPLLPDLTGKQKQKAIALYNIYGFGYALGNHFRSATTGRRGVLFPADLDEIAATGHTKERDDDFGRGRIV